MRYARVFTIALLLLLLAALTTSVSFTSSPVINNGQTTYTDDDLVCEWTASGDTVNLTVRWYKDAVLNQTFNFSGSLPTNHTMPAANTTRDELWVCNVTLINATANVSADDNITIENSGPLTPVIYNASGQDIGIAMNITEDVAFTLDMNSSDADLDTLTYYFIDGKFCSVTNSATGAVSCTATHEYVRESPTNQTENVTQVDIEFWVRDTPPNTKSSERTITFNITPVNDAPQVTIADQSTAVNVTLNITVVATDEEENWPINASLIVALTSAAVSDDVIVTVEGNDTIRIVYGPSPVEYSDVGNHTVTINVTDALGENLTVNFTLEITSINRAPYFTNISPSNYSSPINRTYVLWQGENLIINMTANDPDTNQTTETLTFSDNTSIFVTVTTNSTATNTSDAKGYINYTALNADVGNHTISIIVTDGGGLSNSTEVNFTIKNLNDPPIIYNQSYDAQNTGGNVNITNLTAYLDAPFRYQVNYSDPDEDIGYDNLTWADNTSTINITQAGFIGFTPTGLPRNETINISVVDINGSRDYVTVNLEIRNNTAPYFNDTFPQLNCSEGQQCFFNVSYYAKDDDFGDNVTLYTAIFVGANLSSFSLNSNTGIIDFTPLQSEIGNYTITIVIEDSRAANASQTLNLSVNNTEDYPVWLQYDFSASTIVEDKEFNFVLMARDRDINYSATENLTFTSNLTWVTITYQQTINDTVYALLAMTPNSSQVGSHNIELNVTDSTGRVNSTSLTFTVLADTDPPNVTDIQPYGNTSEDNLTQGWLDVTSFPVNEEDVALFENTTSVRFEVNVTDDFTGAAQLGYTWYYDGVWNASGTGDASRFQIYDFGFFSNGTHNITVRVNDTTLENTTWTWNLNVINVNRPPILAGNLENELNISATSTYANYFLNTSGTGGFYDPDDDLNSDGQINGNETQDLTYSSTACTIATIAYSDEDLRLTPLSVGSCTVTFNATDAFGLTVGSNLVTINVQEVPEGASSTSSSSSGGSASTSTSFIPLETEVETPKPLTIVAPQLVTIYKNRTVIVPIELSNNWTEPLEMIELGAQTNATGVTLRYDTDYIEELDVNETQRVNLIVNGYRLGSNFEVTVTANVTEPLFHDSALILFNSIESAQDGEDVEVKVTFAQDLLSQHDECQELNELLDEANVRLEQGNIDDAHQLVDMVINGCKYLISRTQEDGQKPAMLRTPWINLPEGNIRIISFTALGAAIIVGLLVMLYYHHKTKEEYDF